jgi:hypothetical protein
MTFKSVKCVICGSAISHNQAGIPSCLNLIRLELQAQVPPDVPVAGQKIIYEGPNHFICHSCNFKLAQNVAANAQLVGEQMPEPKSENEISLT